MNNWGGVLGVLGCFSVAIRGSEGSAAVGVPGSFFLCPCGVPGVPRQWGFLVFALFLASF